jgi:hypothetical protein
LLTQDKRRLEWFSQKFSATMDVQGLRKISMMPLAGLGGNSITQMSLLLAA